MGFLGTGFSEPPTEVRTSRPSEFEATHRPVPRAQAVAVSPPVPPPRLELVVEAPIEDDSAYEAPRSPPVAVGTPAEATMKKVIVPTAMVQSEPVVTHPKETAITGEGPFIL